MTPATRAREAAGFTLEQAAKIARISPAYLKRKEREGGFSFAVALRLERAYQCDMKHFSGWNQSYLDRKEAGSRKKATNKKDANSQGGRYRAFPASRSIDSGAGK